MFKKLVTHQTEALMFHSEMIEYFTFLGLKGFKRLHEYQYYDESIGRNNLIESYINEFRELIDKPNQINKLNVIPSNLYGVKNTSNISLALNVENAWKKYIDWEEGTKKLYTEICVSLLNKGELTKYYLVSEYLKDVQEELIEVYDIQSKLANTSVDAILDLDKELFEIYNEKMTQLKRGE